jgi:endonuclease/exonuclease/phosphatase family metal-dependent hydrolase
MRTDRFRLLTYNIRKGASGWGFLEVIQKIREAIQSTHADLVCLQEVVDRECAGKPSQFELLAREIWPHFAFGSNSVSSRGPHGNAILSRFEILNSSNLNLSVNRLGRRGLLGASIHLSERVHNLEIYCTHLDLIQRNRNLQIQQITDRLSDLAETPTPLIIAGDFNDWNQRLHTTISNRLKMKEVFNEARGRPEATFPSWCPTLRLDRIYYRNLKLKHVQSFNESSKPNWPHLSDHLPLLADFETLPTPRKL